MGGSFLNMQEGGLFINTKERTIGPARISEFNKPELVTVTPLSNPNDINDRSIRLDTGIPKRAQRGLPPVRGGPVVLDRGAGTAQGDGAGSSRPPKIVNKIATTVNLNLPDGRKLARHVIPFELENSDSFYV